MTYQILGESMPVVVCDLEPGEAVISEGGSMSWMTPNMQMETSSGGLGKALGRLFSGESLFQNRFTAQGGPGRIAFSSSFPGSIRAVEITPERPIVAQKSSFLAATAGVELSLYLQKKLGAGFFGGEGFILQRLSGRGVAFLEIDGSAMDYRLAPGEQLIVDTGHLAMADESVSMDIQAVRGVKNVVFGGNGLFHTVLTGPGNVTLQSMPLHQFVNLIASRIPRQDS